MKTFPKEESMKKVVNMALLSLVGSIALAAPKTIKSVAHRPTCFELPNTAILSSIKETEVVVQRKGCAHPILINLLSSIQSKEVSPPCGRVSVAATYLCSN